MSLRLTKSQFKKLLTKKGGNHAEREKNEETRTQKAAVLTPQRNKYGAKKTTVFGIEFASKREANRYVVLKSYLRSKQIKKLELQPEFPIVINGIHVCTYRADFQYVQRGPKGKAEWIVEDVKGFRTPVYRLKKKLVRAVLGIQIQEV